MYNYIWADLLRSLKRVPHIVVMVLLNLAAVGMSVYIRMTNWNAVFLMMAGEFFLKLIPILMGIINISIIYGDDFKAKIMQTTIGNGLSRKKVIGSKLIETAILSFLDLLEMTLFFLLVACVMRAGFNGKMVVELFQVMLVSTLQCIVYTSLVQGVIFFRQGVGIANMVYLLAIFGLPDAIIEAVLNIGAVEAVVGRFHLANFLLLRMVDAASSRLMLGTVDIRAFVGIAVYTAIGFLIAVQAFKKRELEF